MMIDAPIVVFGLGIPVRTEVENPYQIKGIVSRDAQTTTDVWYMPVGSPSTWFRVFCGYDKALRGINKSISYEEWIHAQFLNFHIV